METEKSDSDVDQRPLTRIIIISVSEGDKRISLDKLNYMDIEQRSLYYHLTVGNIKSRCILRTSFTKAIEPYLRHENLIFIKPSLLINLDNIDILDKEKIIFTNGEILYFPRKYYEEIYERWSK